MDAAHVGKAGEAVKRMVITVKRCIYTPGGAYDGGDMLLRVSTSDLEMKMARVVRGSGAVAQFTGGCAKNGLAENSCCDWCCRCH